MSSAWWAHRTKFGRVVYDRKKHPFTPADFERIGRKLAKNPPGAPENRDFYVWLIHAMEEVGGEMLDTIFLDLVPGVGEFLFEEFRDALGNLLARLREKGRIYDVIPPGGDPGPGRFKL